MIPGGLGHRDPGYWPSAAGGPGHVPVPALPASVPTARLSH